MLSRPLLPLWAFPETDLIADTEPRGRESLTLPSLWFSAAIFPAWRPLALTFLAFCLALLIGLAALGLVCKSAF